MFNYFGYGSNLNLTSLKAKGVIPIKSEKAILKGWKLDFNVKHWFDHEGGMGNIIESSNSRDCVEGVLHTCPDEHLHSLDLLEAYGIGYDRIVVEVTTQSGSEKAWVYTGLPPYLKNGLLPTRRYLNIILKGAMAASLSDPYIEKLKNHPVLEIPTLPKFEFPEGYFPVFKEEDLKNFPKFTSLCGAVFSLENSRIEFEPIIPIFGGKDLTLFHAKRHDSSTGEETLEEVLNGKISSSAKNYLNTYLHAYDKEFKLVGKLIYSNEKT
ncbi:AIG2 family protein [Algoriphagus boseongensis]|uniref:AIG2 family protein n=1 Tax=Algoriphagus boseongensis TaxID=1442587 RepID=A0A4R6TB95_9BACT|nr:gamma-glutamylcyclotransferase family protein [Algoriphagus boseongensis]TDQ19479.1 AIG2 family protein [Algoriphagus boseongensis]